ncbi:hypothetical protein ABZ348_30910 [Streptomyces sp. NPDC005963]|uniref:hypothetical protein n=1 Tax=Streptomyces sp. NPDC005963 TaxID=3156721 RepID=UPI0033C9CA54
MGEISITIKFSGDKDATWATFRGTPGEVRAEILATFGMDPATQQGLSLSSVIVNATSIAHGKGVIATALGATVVEETATGGPSKPEGDPWAAAAGGQGASTGAESASAAAEDPNAYILGQIEKATTVQGLKKLWAENQGFFKDSAVMAAWKAKGRSLQAPAA